MSSTTLYNIAEKVCLSKGDKSNIHIAKYILYGKSAAAEMCKRGFMPIQSVMLDIDAGTNSAKLPPDYVKYVRVGSCICDRILELDYDSTLCVREPVENFCPPKQTEPVTVKTNYYRLTTKVDGTINFVYTTDMQFPDGETIAVTNGNPQYVCSITVPKTNSVLAHSIDNIGDCPGDNTTTEVLTETQRLESDCKCLCRNAIPAGYNSYYMWNNIYYYGRLLGPMYTLPAYRSPGFFKIENGRIYLNSVCAGSHVVLQYKSNGVSDAGQTEIPIEMEDTILSFMVWKDAFYDKTNSLSYIQMCKEEYIRQKDLLTMQTVLAGVLSMLKVEMKYTFAANIGR